MSDSANGILPPFLATPSIELKKRIGARKKTKKKRQKKETHFKTKQKKERDTFQKPLESLSGNI